MALQLKKVAVHGFKGNEKKEFEGLLNKWVKLVNQYSVQLSDSEDACYWYNERATLGVFAAAAWKNKGWCALEEFSNNKQDDSGEQKNGRCDLYMLGPTKSYACEAKQAWQPIGKKVINQIGNLEKMLKHAENDARKLDTQEADRRLALCFCIPSFPKSLIEHEHEAKRKAASKRIIQDWLRELDKFKSVALAYIFPENNRLSTQEGGSRIFPGVVLLIREI
jgi:hypothetical protein